MKYVITLKDKVCSFNTPSVAKFTHLKACFFTQVKVCIYKIKLCKNSHTLRRVFQKGVYFYTPYGVYFALNLWRTNYTP
jgi:hypothetical protein